MNKVYIIIIVLILLAGGALFFMGQGNKAEAPEMTINEGEDGAPVSNTMPVLGETNVEEMIVVETKEFTVSGENFSFTPNVIKVSKGDNVKITFKNTAGFHDFVIDEYGVATKQTQAPNEETIEFIADKAGSFEFYCSVGAHRAQGMKGTLVVE